MRAQQFRYIVARATNRRNCEFREAGFPIETVREIEWAEKCSHFKFNKLISATIYQIMIYQNYEKEGVSLESI